MAAFWRSNEACNPTKPLVRLFQDVPLLLIGEVELIGHPPNQNKALYLVLDVARGYDRLLLWLQRA
jgi:hypothetical protein